MFQTCFEENFCRKNYLKSTWLYFQLIVRKMEHIEYHLPRKNYINKTRHKYSIIIFQLLRDFEKDWKIQKWIHFQTLLVIIIRLSLEWYWCLSLLSAVALNYVLPANFFITRETVRIQDLKETQKKEQESIIQNTTTPGIRKSAGISILYNYSKMSNMISN